jgi:hypothetical protein
VQWMQMVESFVDSCWEANNQGVSYSSSRELHSVYNSLACNVCGHRRL